MGLKLLRTSTTAAFFNLSPFYTLISKNVVSVSDISAVFLIVGWCLFACSMNQRSRVTKTSSLSGFITLWLRTSVSTFAMKMLAKAKCNFITNDGVVYL